MVHINYYNYSFSFSASSAYLSPADKRVKPSVKTVCTDEATATLQKRFECTYWQMFRDAATQDSNISLEENK